MEYWNPGLMFDVLLQKEPAHFHFGVWMVKSRWLLEGTFAVLKEEHRERASPIEDRTQAMLVWLKINQEELRAGFGPCFHLPGQPILVTVFLSHSQAQSCDSLTGPGATDGSHWVPA